MEAEVFPVLAQATILEFKRLAWVTPAVIPLSLKDPVGFSPWCLRYNFFSPTYSAQRGAS